MRSGLKRERAYHSLSPDRLKLLRAVKDTRLSNIGALRAVLERTGGFTGSLQRLISQSGLDISVGTLVLLTLEKAHRLLVILSAVAVLWLVTYLTPYHLIGFEGAQRALDLNVILLLASMMALVGVLKTTGVFTWAAAGRERVVGATDLAGIESITEKRNSLNTFLPSVRVLRMRSVSDPSRSGYERSPARAPNIHSSPQTPMTSSASTSRSVMQDSFPWRSRGLPSIAGAPGGRKYEASGSGAFVS